MNNVRNGNIRMFRKNVLFCFVIAALMSIFSAAPVWANEEEDLFGDLSIEELNADIQALADVHYADPKNRAPLGPNIMAAMLINADIKAPIFKSTSVPSGRDVLYLLPYKIAAVEYGGFALTYFYNMTGNMKVTVGNLINFENAIDRDRLKTFIQGFTAGASLQEIESLIPLFKKINLQERKTGMLLQSGFIKGPFSIQLNSSLILGERNFFLSNKDRKDVESFFPGQKFNEREFYRLRVGMGDTRVKFGLNTLNMTSFQNDIGLETILPTSRLSYSPKLKLGLAQVTYDTDELEKNGLQTLRAIRDNLLSPHMGNNGHFGFGCYHETKTSIFHDMVQLWTRTSYDVLFPNEEDRLFLFKKTLEPAVLHGIGNDDAGKAAFSNFIRQYVCPSSFNATVYPGGVFNFVTSATTDITKRLRYALGYDFYSQQAEFIRSIHNTNVSLDELDVAKAQARSVRQHKLFTELFWHKTVKKKDFGVAIGGDLTFASKGIGEDWTLYWKVAGSF